jgi:hypothetical protein
MFRKSQARRKGAQSHFVVQIEDIGPSKESVRLRSDLTSIYRHYTSMRTVCTACNAAIVGGLGSRSAELIVHDA